MNEYLVAGIKFYEDLIDKGAAKECARMILPMCSQTTLYMTGSLRSWLSYLNVRLDKNTQLEHREIARAIARMLVEIFPNTCEAVSTFNNFEGNFM